MRARILREIRVQLGHVAARVRPGVCFIEDVEERTHRVLRMVKNPVHPERICWGCERRCRADDLACGNETVRAQHPCELFGEDWLTWARENGYEVVDEDEPVTAPRAEQHASSPP